jgi:hypothetical protein
MNQDRLTHDFIPTSREVNIARALANAGFWPVDLQILQQQRSKSRRIMPAAIAPTPPTLLAFRYGRCNESSSSGKWRVR